VKNIEVFGTSDDKEVQKYQTANLRENNQFIITKTKSAFPSPLEFDEDGNIK